MSRYYSDPEMIEPKRASFCANFLRYTWKTITCLFSHITLVSMVVSYCILGAVTFQHLEQDHEKEVKRNISKVRNNITEHLWTLTKFETPVFIEENFTQATMMMLKDFEQELLKAITKDGWDGDESTDNVQWSLAGALFYSIIVITTIGYGHIAPKTPWGKIATIFYAIMGIPLMLLCLSNIGDIMATSFRFIYWKVCCYVCTRKPKKSKRRSARSGTIRGQGSKNGRSRTASIRRSVRTSTKSADSGYVLSDMSLPAYHSDTELRYLNELRPDRASQLARGASLPRPRPASQRSQLSDTTLTTSRRPQQQQQVGGSTKTATLQQRRGGSLDRRAGQGQAHQPIAASGKGIDVKVDEQALARTPLYCNKYVVDKGELLEGRSGNSAKRQQHQLNVLSNEDVEQQLQEQKRRARSMPRSQYLEPREPSPDEESDSSKIGPRKNRRQIQSSSSPKIMSPLGYGHKSKYLDDPFTDDEYWIDEDGVMMDAAARQRIRPVPIWLCVFLVVSYIFAGTFLFSAWEGWEYMDSAYFCFITLTTIGFGDFVPANRVNSEQFKQNIAFCSLYLLFGISLLAMSFNLVQEEVIANVKRVARTLGIIKSEQQDDDTDTE